MKAEEIFKDQLFKKQKASANVGTKTFFGKEIVNDDTILYFVYQKNAGDMDLTKITADELKLVDSELQQEVDEKGKPSTLFGSVPVFSRKKVVEAKAK